MSKENYRALWIGLLILLLAAAGRMIHLNAQSLWVDEGYTYVITQQPDVLDYVRQDVHPPLYFLGMDVWVKLAGTSEVALRIFSFFPSMFSVAVVYQLAKELLWARGQRPNAALPLLAALLLALADAEIYLSQEARMYTLHVLLAVISMWAFLRWIRLHERRGQGALLLVIWIISTTALVHTHYQGVWTPFIEGLYALIFLRGKVRWYAIGALIVSGLLFMPWMLWAGIDQLDNGGGYNRSTPSDWAALVDLVRMWFSQQWPLMMGLALLGTVILVENGRTHVRWRPIGPAALLVAWIVIPVGMTFVLNLWLPILSAVRVSQITPAVALLTAFGLANLKYPARAFLVAVILVYGVTTVDFERPKPPWREVGAKLAQFAQPTDLVLTDVGGGDYQITYYADKLLPQNTRVESAWQHRHDDPAGYYAWLPGLVNIYDTVWLMHWENDTTVFGALVDTGHVRTATFSTPHQISAETDVDLNVYRYDRIPDSAQVTFKNGMALRKFAFDAETMRLDLWWSTNSPLTADYTTSALILDAAGQLVAQYDSSPQVSQRPTTGWQPGEVIYDPKPLQLQGVDTLAPGKYTLVAQVYLWSPEGITQVQTSDGQDKAQLSQFVTSESVE